MNNNYSDEIGSNAVSLIHDQLEVFKYISDFLKEKKKDNKIRFESGEGLPISIVTLPDFVLDFHNERLQDPNHPVCSVGGHAGLITSVLMHLFSDEDATHRVHFCTNTGRFAKMLLEDEFKADEEEDSYDTYKRYCEPFVFIRKGQPRCAYANGNEFSPAPLEFYPELSTEEHIETQPFVLKAIRSARTVYIGSFKTPDFPRILQKVLSTMKEGSLFLDTRRANKKSYNHLEVMLNILKSQMISSPKNEVILFVGGDEQEHLLEVASSLLGKRCELQEIAKEFHMRLIYYDDNSVSMFSSFDNELSGQVFDNFKCQIKDTYSSARFRAGIILSWSVYKTLELLPKIIEFQSKESTLNWGNGLYDSFVGRWNGIGLYPWKGIVAYSIALASIHSENRGSSLLTDLMSSAGEIYKLNCKPSEKSMLDIRTEPGKNSRRICLEDNNIAYFIQLAARRRYKGKDGLSGLLNELLAQCDIVPCKEDCIIEKRKASVMIDLDGTLMESKCQRDRALEGALKELHETKEQYIKGKNELFPSSFITSYPNFADRLKFFEEMVYDRHLFFEWLGLGDFRQRWNHEGWYATYIILASKPKIKEELDKVISEWQQIMEKAQNDSGNRLTNLKVDIDKEERLKSLRECDTVTNFIQEYEYNCRNHGVEINKAIGSFSQVQLHPLKEARDLLTSLRDSGAFNLYIVSEGDPETQWKKLCSIGLDHYFGRSHVLTTGDVAPEYDNERKLFEFEKSELQISLKSIQQKQKYTKDMRHILTNITGDIANSPRPECETMLLDLAQGVHNKHDKRFLTQKNRLKQDCVYVKQALKVAECVEVILARLRKKLSLAFYAAVIRAIMRNPDRPLDILRDLQKIRGEEHKTPQMKLAMIGDRQTKDIHPPLELLMDPNTKQRKGLVTIRLLSGKYAIDEDENPDKPDGRFSPDFLAMTLAHVKAILLSTSTWKKVTCLNHEPPLFNWAVNLNDPDRVPGNPEDNNESIGINHLFRGMAMSDDKYRVINNICAAFFCEHFNRSSDDKRNQMLELLFETNESNPLEEKYAARISAFVLAGGISSSKTSEDEEIKFAEYLVKCRKNKHNTWINERVLNALHWIKDNARYNKAKIIAVEAVKYSQ